MNLHGENLYFFGHSTKHHFINKSWILLFVNVKHEKTLKNFTTKNRHLRRLIIFEGLRYFSWFSTQNVPYNEKKKLMVEFFWITFIKVVLDRIIAKNRRFLD